MGRVVEERRVDAVEEVPDLEKKEKNAADGGWVVAAAGWTMVAAAGSWLFM